LACGTCCTRCWPPLNDADIAVAPVVAQLGVAADMASAIVRVAPCDARWVWGVVMWVVVVVWWCGGVVVWWGGSHSHPVVDAVCDVGIICGDALVLPIGNQSAAGVRGRAGVCAAWRSATCVLAAWRVSLRVVQCTGGSSAVSAAADVVGGRQWPRPVGVAWSGRPGEQRSVCGGVVCWSVRASGVWDGQRVVRSWQ
jgi:hypothetical protein